MRIVQFTDTHLVPNIGETFLGVDTFVTLQEAVEAAKSLAPPPNAIIITGDLAEGGDTATYRRIREIFEPLPIAVFVVPGNHDNETVMADVFRESNISCADHAIIDECLFIFLDSHIKGKSHGLLSTEALSRVRTLLEAHGNKPVIISLHHPISSPCPSLGCKLHNEDKILHILNQVSCPIAVLSGHLIGKWMKLKGTSAF